ncbi:hypothetical protein SRHO_G00081250 [Serrasalmus rhombeus]
MLFAASFLRLSSAFSLRRKNGSALVIPPRRHLFNLSQLSGLVSGWCGASPGAPWHPQCECRSWKAIVPRPLPKPRLQTRSW